MSRTDEQEIQALTAAFVEDLTKLVRQHTLEIVLAQLETGASPRPRAPRRAAVEADVVLHPARPRRAQRPRGKAFEPESAVPEPAVPEPAEVAPEKPPQPEAASLLAAVLPAELEEPVAATA